MGLFSKLFGGDKEAEKAVRDLFKGIVNEAQKQENAPKPTQAETPAAPQSAPAPASASTDPYGEEMPVMPNQYNYNGTYLQYFEEIFTTEFPTYRIEKTRPNNSKSTVFTFWNGPAKALVVELMPCSSEAKKLRETCRKEGTPYLRYYIDGSYQGWWNIRSYVVERTRNAIR